MCKCRTAGVPESEKNASSTCRCSFALLGRRTLAWLQRRYKRRAVLLVLVEYTSGERSTESWQLKWWIPDPAASGTSNTIPPTSHVLPKN
jgi:hypothetical protein